MKVVLHAEVCIANSHRTSQGRRRIVCYCDERTVEINLESLSQSIIDPHIERVLTDMRSLSTLQPVMFIECLDVDLSCWRHIGIICIERLLSESEVRQEDEHTAEQNSHMGIVSFLRDQTGPGLLFVLSVQHVSFCCFLDDIFSREQREQRRELR